MPLETVNQCRDLATKNLSVLVGLNADCGGLALRGDI
jgi:hypothetical protein